MKKFRLDWSRLVATAVLLSVLPSTHAADVEFFGLVKMQGFAQSNPTAPELVEEVDGDGDLPFAFNAFVDLTSSNAVTNATLTLPGGAMRTLALSEGGFNREYFDGALFKPDLDSIYSNGTFTVFLQTRNDGNKMIPLTFPSSDAYPNPPRISNFSSAQSINAAAGFTLTWDAFAGGLMTDFIQLEIDDLITETPVFETSGPGQPGSLNGTSNAVVIPAGTLSAGQRYRGRIFFARIVDFDDTTYGGGVTGVAAFLSETVFDVRTTGGTDNTPPNLEAQSPFNTEFGVRGSTAVAFRFDEPMNTALGLGASVSWSANVNPGLVTYTWSADGQSLFCVYPPGFPTNALITWELNPGGSPENIRDLGGNKLPSQGGSFNTGDETGAGEKDLRSLALTKGRVFRQTGSAAQPAELYLFSMTSDLNTLNSVTNGLVTLPSARVVTPELDGDAFDFEALYSSQAQLDSFFPDGAHQLRFNTVHDGTRTFNFTLSGSTYPNAPQILDFATTQSVNPSNAFVLSWGAFTGGTANDFIGLEIQSEDESAAGGTFETSNIGEPGALNGTDTSVTIPGFTFAPGRRYRAELFFAKVGQVDTTTYPGVIAASGYFSVTFFELQTIGTAIQPSLRIAQAGNNLVRITVTGEKNLFYTVESTDNLSGNPAQWATRNSGVANINVNGFTASFEFDDGVFSSSGSRFYRAREGSDFGGGP